MGKQGKAVLEKEAFRQQAWRQAEGEAGGDVRGLKSYYDETTPT